MKKILTVALFFGIIFADETTSLKVKGMTCQVGCANKVKKVLNEIDGIKSCDVNFENGIASVNFNEEKISPEEIKKILGDKTEFDISLENEPEKKKSSIMSFFKNLFKS